MTALMDFTALNRIPENHQEKFCSPCRKKLFTDQPLAQVSDWVIIEPKNSSSRLKQAIFFVERIPKYKSVLKPANDTCLVRASTLQSLSINLFITEWNMKAKSVMQ